MTVTESPVALCAALADETRWAILCRLGKGPGSASELATEMAPTRQAIAHHLTILAEAGLVAAERQGRNLRYRAIGSQLSRLAHDLEVIGHGWENRLDRLRTIAEER